MQQQMPQPEQCGNQQQLPQPVMICPVQYVYDASLMMPQQDNQVQQNQILINVKNPPPWIQNRSQNQIVYVQQVPNYQPYMHPQMIQNPMYHPQMSYQIQPMMTQDNRQYIQIPNLNHYNTVQNPTQITREEADKMPLLSQMLNQKANVNREPNVNNVRANMTPNVNIIRPTMKNRLVQTDNVSPNIKGRPRTATAQIITINPMQNRQITNQKQEAVMNVRPNMCNDVPPHLRTKLPSSIIVKTINRPVHPRTLVRPFDVMPAPQNFYYNPIVLPAPTAEARSTMTNTESQHMNPNNNFQEIQTRTVPMQYSIPISNVSPYVNMPTVNNTVNIGIQKQSKNSFLKPIVNPAEMQNDNDKKIITETNTVKSTETETQTEEKFVRNTVFVQARGRIRNDKEISQNQNLKRTIDDRLKEDSKETQRAVNSVETRIKATTVQISKKIKVVVVDNTSSSQNHKISENSSGANLPMSIQTQQSRISNLRVKADNVHKEEAILNTPDTKNNNNDSLGFNLVKSEEIKAENIQEPATLSTPEINKTKNDLKGLNRLNSEEPKPMRENKDLKQNNSVVTPTNNETKNSGDACEKIYSKLNNNTVLKPENKLEDWKKEGKITVLTHVLDGYIIQESDVAFPIHKPIMDKQIENDKDAPKNQTQNMLNTMKNDINNEKHESKGHFPWKYLNTSIESEKEMEFAVIEKNCPFANIKRSTLESWSADQLATHLEKYNWTETAAKLLDEEIDGESVLLVNKDQLEAIGISEEHAEVIASFAAR